MNTGELRIGNYVSFQLALDQVEGVVFDKIYLKASGVYDSKWVDPVNLNDQWLIDLGFEKDRDYDNTFNRYINVMNGFTTISIDVEAQVLLLDNMEIKIKYVHQLQNLYHALTGEELCN